MKRIGLAAAFATLCITPVSGQAQQQKPAAAKPPAAAAETKSAAQPVASAPRRSRRHEDARSCLAHATNLEIRRCAEQYR